MKTLIFLTLLPLITLSQSDYEPEYLYEIQFTNYTVLVKHNPVMSLFGYQFYVYLSSNDTASTVIITSITVREKKEEVDSLVTLSWIESIMRSLTGSIIFEAAAIDFKSEPKFIFSFFSFSYAPILVIKGNTYVRK